MRGRSKVVFKKKGRNTLEGMEDQEDNEDLVNRAKWLRQLAGYHSKLGNKLITIARRIKTNAAIKDDPGKKKRNEELKRREIEAGRK